jgi:uncharacterized repeat protein (TIGR02543 family)
MKAKAAGAAIASAIMVLAGCGGSQGVAESSAPAIRGDMASSEASDPANQDLTSPFDPEVIDAILNLFANGEGVGVEPGTTILSTAEAATIVEWDEPSTTTVVKPPVDAPVVIFQQRETAAPEEDDGVVTDEQDMTVKVQLGVTVVSENTREVVETITKIDFWSSEKGPGEPLDPGSADLRSVTFNSNALDATGTMPMQVASTETALRENVFKRSGYVFDGWATSVSGSSAYADGFKYPFTSNVTLYARWATAPSTTVTFNANGGDGTMTSQTANQLTALKANEFTKSGYVFDGWAFISSGSKAYANSDDYKFKENATLYARWVAAPSMVATQAATVTGAPALTSLSRRSKTEVWVTFSAPSSTGGVPITGYTVTATLIGGGSVTQSFPAQAGTVSVGPLTRYSLYTFTVKAVNSVGTSKPSNAKTFRVDR